MKLHTSLLLLLTPIVLLVIGCIIIQAAWYYYIIAWLSGSGIGILALLTWFQAHKNTTIKTKKDVGTFQKGT
jgi:hypothetical protein